MIQDTDKRRNRGSLADQLRRAMWVRDLASPKQTGGSLPKPDGREADPAVPTPFIANTRFDRNRPFRPQYAKDYRKLA